MGGHYLQHPLYQNDAELGNVTDALMAAGQTVFQIYQMPNNEQEHSTWLLGMTDPEQKAKRVLSLGCGIGGMEGYWKILRPEMRFELVNISQSQIKRMLCPGRKICANAETYRSKRPAFDLVVISYLLGHVDIDMTLHSAMMNLAPWGRVLIYDVFEVTNNFRETLHYDAPTFGQIERFGVSNFLRFREVIQDRAQIPLSPFFAQRYGWVGLESRPGLFVFQNE